MEASTIRPTGVERTFGPDEIIVTKTDTKGRITYANDVFLRMAAYEEKDVIGKPHNLIRHPDMPRCAFKLLWDRIEAGEEMFAYVVNLAADGAHYWVFAHVTPTFGPRGEIVGYHSNRRSPSRAAVDAIRPIYAALLAEEKRHGDRSSGMAASWDLLHQVLADKGVSYDELVWSLAGAGAAR